VIEAEYYAPFLNHAPLEPMNCTALVKGDRVEVWAPTQNAEATHATAAATAGVPLENVEVHLTHLGGGFGRRGFQDYARQAVTIAKAVEGRPVKLLWSREEDMQHDFYRPMTLMRFKAALDAAGSSPPGASGTPATPSWRACGRRRSRRASTGTRSAASSICPMRCRT